jgi:hypothetical protein
LGLCRGGGGGEKGDFLGNGAPQVVERFAEIARVVVGFVGILRPGDVYLVEEEGGRLGSSYVTWSNVVCTFLRASTRFSSSM